MEMLNCIVLRVPTDKRSQEKEKQRQKEKGRTPAHQVGDSTGGGGGVGGSGTCSPHQSPRHSPAKTSGPGQSFFTAVLCGASSSTGHQQQTAASVAADCVAGAGPSPKSSPRHTSSSKSPRHSSSQRRLRAENTDPPTSGMELFLSLVFKSGYK